MRTFAVYIQNDIIPSIILINAVTSAVSICFISLLLVVLFRFCKRRKPPKQCNYCKADVYVEHLEEHFKTCAPYITSVLRSSNPYRTSKLKDAFTEIIMGNP